MRHVHHQMRADLVGNRAEIGKRDLARVSRAAGDNDARLVLDGELAHLVHVDAMRLGMHHVGHRLEPFARLVHGRAVREMAAGREAQAENRVAGLRQRHEHTLVRLAARVRLHVGETAREQLLGAVDRELLGDVDVLAPAVVALPGIAFRVLVGQHRAGRLEHRLGDDVLRCDELDLKLLAAELFADRDLNLGITVGNRRGEEARLRGGTPGLQQIEHSVVSLLLCANGLGGALARAAMGYAHSVYDWAASGSTGLLLSAPVLGAAPHPRPPIFGGRAPCRIRALHSAARRTVCPFDSGHASHSSVRAWTRWSICSSV